MRLTATRLLFASALLAGSPSAPLTAQAAPARVEWPRATPAKIGDAFRREPRSAAEDLILKLHARRDAADD